MFIDLCEKNNYTITDEALKRISDVIKNKIEEEKKDFSNGRLVRNIFETVIMNQARRVYSLKTIEESDLKNIMAEDTLSL